MYNYSYIDIYIYNYIVGYRSHRLSHYIPTKYAVVDVERAFAEELGEPLPSKACSLRRAMAMAMSVSE